MVDIRYHIYSLAAVFLALAVGIVIGTSFARSSPSDASSRKTIQRYENNMRVLKREIEMASDEATTQESVAVKCQDFAKAVAPIIVRDKLAWRNVALIRTGDYDELTGSVKQALELSGARVTCIVQMSRNFPFDDNDKVAQVLAANGLMPDPEQIKPRDRLFSIIAETLYSANHTAALPKLEDAAVATFTGDFTRTNRLVVLVGGASDRKKNTAENVDTRLITELEKLGATVVGCEPMEVGNSYVPTWHKTGIATVDNADTAMGQVALVYALNGERAKFGVKNTADRIIPQTLETK